jgi:hypothetical protein
MYVAHTYRYMLSNSAFQVNYKVDATVASTISCPTSTSS